MIVVSADNRSPMLDKPQYVSWKSQMELYIQGLLPDVYALINHHKISKDIWDRVKLLMQGASLSRQERECMLYDGFDKFSHVKGETLYQYYLQFAQLINDMNIILNSLPLEWGKFMTDELLEYVIDTCLKSFNERDNKAPSTPVTRKKQVTFSDRSETSSSNAQKHEVHQKVQQTNIPVIPSTRVNTSTEASGSKTRSNTKENRILPAKTENKKKVEDHLRTNKSVWTKVNRVDSSISSKRVVINSNSESVNSASDGMCVVNVLNSVNATPTLRIVLHKGKLTDNSLNKTKQIWQPKSKLSDNSLYQIGEIELESCSMMCHVMLDLLIAYVYPNKHLF
ncbi:hypothetical protein Tco_1249188 [Tanacetum coccineum]